MFTESKADAQRMRAFFLTVLMLSSIGLVATDIYLPSLPFIQIDLSTTKNLTRLTLAYYLVSYGFSQLIYGPLSDKLGRRKIAFLGLTLSLFGSLICILAFNISLLILGRLIQGLGLGAGPAMARAIRKDTHSGGDLALFGSSIIIGTSLIFAIAPVLGGYIQHYMGWRINFLFIFIYTLIGILGVQLYLPETNKELNPSSTNLKILINNYTTLLKSPIFIGYSMCSSLAFAGLTAYFTTGPFFFENVLGMTAKEYGWLGTFIATGLGLGGICNKIWIRFFGRHRMLVLGIIFIFLSSILMLFFAIFSLINTFVIMFPMLMYAFGAGIIFTNSFAGAFVPFAKIAGSAAALFGCIQIFGGAIASGIMAQVSEQNQIPLSITLVMTSIIACVFRTIAFHALMRQKP